jgi:hypothetical protein
MLPSVMTKNTRIFLLICLGAFCASFVVQTVFQSILGGSMSVWGGNAGWQREIAFWNVGVALIVVLLLRLNDQRAALTAVQGFTVLFLLLGLNHMQALFTNSGALFHWPPMALNLIGFFFGVKLLYNRGA